MPWSSILMEAFLGVGGSHIGPGTARRQRMPQRLWTFTP